MFLVRSTQLHLCLGMYWYLHLGKQVENETGSDSQAVVSTTFAGNTLAASTSTESGADAPSDTVRAESQQF